MNQKYYQKRPVHDCLITSNKGMYTLPSTWSKNRFQFSRRRQDFYLQKCEIEFTVTHLRYNHFQIVLSYPAEATMVMNSYCAPWQLKYYKAILWQKWRQTVKLTTQVSAWCGCFFGETNGWEQDCSGRNMNTESANIAKLSQEMEKKFLRFLEVYTVSVSLNKHITGLK